MGRYGDAMVSLLQGMGRRWIQKCHPPVATAPTFFETYTLPLQNELDNTVGEIMRTIREAKVHRKTFVFFTSDNG